MRYFADAIVKYVTDEVEKSPDLILRFVLPSYPAELLLTIGEQLEEELTRMSKKMQADIGFEYGIAYGLGEKWASGTESERRVFEEIKRRGWYNETDNLTSLRHITKQPDQYCLVVLFAGYDDIRDQSSLKDFFHLDQRTIWEICIGRSFENWVVEAVRKYVNRDGNEEQLGKIATFFAELYAHGLADPLQVSYYLDNREFSSAMDGQDAFKIVLCDLSDFGLPNMLGLETRDTSKYSAYITDARKFITYDRFLENTQRNKAVNRIEKFREEADEAPSPELLGGFSDVNELIESLIQYIETGSDSHLACLKKSSFPYINDEILNYKPKVKERSRKKDSIIKVRGHALEAFIEGLWRTLSDFKKETQEIVAFNDIEEISLHSLEYEHHFETDGDDLAKEFLKRLIGGIDEYIEGHVLIGSRKEGYVKIKSNLAPFNSDIKYRPARSNSEPRLRFEVTVIGKSGIEVQQGFYWMLGENSQARFLVNLYDWAIDRYKEKNYRLPAFSLEYVNEVFMAKDPEDAVRILKAGLERETGSAHELISDSEKGINLYDDLLATAHCYEKFLHEYSENGFFYALDKDFDVLRQKYARLMESYLEISSKSPLGPALMKAFMIVPQEFTEVRNWEHKSYLPSGIVTPLHPALLQMIDHQYVYICHSFSEYATSGLKETKNKELETKDWYRILDLSNIKWPILGIVDENLNLNTNVRSFDYIHLVGEPEEEYSTISSRLLRQEGDDEDEISDTELFRATQESNLMKHVLLDYCELHPYANDGISIGVYCGGSIQHIVGGIDAFLREVAKDRESNPYFLNLLLFSDTPDDTGILKWIDAWREHWDRAEGSSAKKHYSNARISVFYKVVPEKDISQLERQLQDVDLDVFFFKNFTTPKRSEFLSISDERLFDLNMDDYLKFPILEKANCLIEGVGDDSERKLVFSNRQFQLSTLHLEVMVRLCHRLLRDVNARHVIVTATDFDVWRGAIDVAHEGCVWVVCIDSVVDEKLIREVDRNREIIGCGTGVGAHGEFNFTISTEQFRLSDIEKRISHQLASILSNYEPGVCDKMASVLVKQGISMPGLSVVKATSRNSEYIRDFIAYSLVRKLLPKSEEALCDEIISLDGFLHWFDFGPQNMRPDLLRLQVMDVGGTLEIRAQIIECKLAKRSEGYLEKALQQVEEGLNQLVPRFKPRQTERPMGIAGDEDDDNGLSPDQRYWWVQLHRLISSRGRIPLGEEEQMIQALEFLSDGYFNIQWEAAVVALWTDIPDGNVSREKQSEYQLRDQNLEIFSVQCGKDFMRAAVLEGTDFEIFDGASPPLRYEHIPLSYAEVEEIEDEVDENKEVEGSVEKPHITGEPIEPQETVLVKRIPGRILLGSGTAGGRDVYWEFGHPELPNRHLLILGASGTGKTYTVQAIMCELAKHGINSLIVDYTSGFTNKHLEPIVLDKLKPKQHIVRNEPLPINPFRKQRDFIDDTPIEDTPFNVAQRVTGVFSEVFYLGDQQKAVLYRVISEGVSELGDDFNLRILMDRLDEISTEGGPLSGPAASVATKMRSFVDSNPFGHEDPNSWEKLFLDPLSRCHIIQLAGFPKDSARLITEFSLIDLYWYYRGRGSEDDPRIIVLDEIQNLDHRLESPLGQLLTEGRKFGISLILATQTLSNFTKDQKDRLFQASHKLFFKPADTEIKSYAQLLADATSYDQEHWVQQLSGLRRGECYSLGHAYNPVTGKLEVNKANKIRIKSLEERFR